MTPRRLRQRAYEPLRRYAEPLEPEWVHGPVPKFFWQDHENLRRFLRWLGNKLGFKHWEDWYAVTQDQIYGNHGESLFHKYYGSCPALALPDIFPEYDWLEWRFRQVPTGFWNGPKNRRRYMEWLGRELSLHQLDDWYRVTNADFQKHDGGGLLMHFNGASQAAILDAFPSHDWKEWLFAHVPAGFWKSQDNRRRFMLWLGRELNYARMEDWYRITNNVIKSHGGSGLLWFAYNSSPVAAVMDCFPEYDWKEWLFDQVPVGFWQSRPNRLRYLKWLETQLSIKRPEDWYRVTQPDFWRHRGSGLLMAHYRGSVFAAAKDLYPEHDWCEWLFKGPPKKLWEKREVRLRYLTWLAAQVGVKCPSDWQRVTKRDFKNHGGSHLLQCHYGGSVEAAICEARRN